MQAVQDMPAGFKGSTLSCDGASFRMGTDEIVSRGVMDSGGHYSAAGLVAEHCSWHFGELCGCVMRLLPAGWRRNAEHGLTPTSLVN